MGSIQCRNQSSFFDRFQRFKGVGLPERFSASSVKQLEGLDKEFYFTDPSNSQLYVQLVFPKMLLFDALLHMLDVTGQPFIHKPAINEGGNHGFKRFFCPLTSRNSPAFDQSLAFP